MLTLVNTGMWGATRGSIRNMSNLLNEFVFRQSGEDQTFLTALVWPIAVHDQISHDAYSCRDYPNSRAFPTQRLSDFSHVGEVWYF